MAITAQQEKFCQFVISGLNQSDAYRAAYSCGKMKDKTINNRAYELMKNGDVAGRISELRSPVVKKLQYTLEKAMEEAEDALKVSREKEQGGAMVAAVTLRAKLNGLLVDRKEIRTGPLDDLNFSELSTLESKLRGFIAGNSSGTTH